MKNKHQKWSSGDIFLIPQKDGGYSVGQVLVKLMPSVVSCSFYAIRHTGKVTSILLPQSKLIAVLSVFDAPLSKGDWKVISHAPIYTPKELWPNEQFRDTGWVGANFHSAGVAEDLLNAYYKLTPWDDWHDPFYLDKLMISPAQRPFDVVLKKT
jgi:hypothetical protein